MNDGKQREVKFQEFPKFGDDSGVYEGEFLNGIPNGRGIFISTKYGV